MKDPHKYVLLPCLPAKMRQAGAINHTLAEAAGVCFNTVDRARQGRKVRLNLGIAMYQALATKQFTRRKRA